MKLINKFKSLNFDKRKLGKIEFIIIHYTALPNYIDAIKYLCDKDNKVSCHYLISQQGNIFNIVHESKRAWHAGLSYWNGNVDINSLSIGIELDYSPNHKNNKFNIKMMKSLISLLKKIKKKYSISNKGILGHSDIAPYRKIDPGNNFPWKDLYRNGLGYIPNNTNNKTHCLLKLWIKKIGFKSRKHSIIFMLAYIGYNVSLVNNNEINYKSLINIYTNRHFTKKTTKPSIKKIFDFIEKHFLSLVLTRRKK